MNLSIYDAALAALRVEQTRINAAVTAMEAICASGLSTSVDAINQAMVNAAGIVAPPHEDDADDDTPVPAARPVRMSAKPGSHEARFLGMRPRLLQGPAFTHQLRDYLPKLAEHTADQHENAVRNTLTWARAKGLVGRTGQTWSLTDAGRDVKG